MGSPIFFFKKNHADISRESVVVTASQGQDYADFVRNRSNRTAWMTTGSVDADNTTFEIDFMTDVVLHDIVLVLHNFKNYSIQYWNGASYVSFSPAISVTNNADETTWHQFTEVTTSKVKLTITGTMIANSDKRLFQFLTLQRIGQLEGYPDIKSPTMGRNRIVSTMLSGKKEIRENVGNFSTKLSLRIYSNDNDLDVFESLFNQNEGFLVWLSGGDETQFKTLREGYRLQDFFLVKCQNEYKPELYKGGYLNGVKVELDLVEVID